MWNFIQICHLLWLILECGNWKIITICATDLEVPSWFKRGIQGIPRPCDWRCGCDLGPTRCIERILYCKTQECQPGCVLLLSHDPSRDTVINWAYHSGRKPWCQMRNQDTKPWNVAIFLRSHRDSSQELISLSSPFLMPSIFH